MVFLLSAYSLPNALPASYKIIMVQALVLSPGRDNGQNRAGSLVFPAMIIASLLCVTERSTILMHAQTSLLGVVIMAREQLTPKAPDSIQLIIITITSNPNRT
jgi:hypothetical protein